MKTEINLLPIHPRKKNRNKFFPKNPWLSLVIGSLVLFLMMYGVLAIMNQVRLEEIKSVEEAIKNQSDFRIPYENLTIQNELLDHREKLLEALNLDKNLPLKVLVGVQEALPVEMDIVDYQFKGNELILAGRTQNQEEILAFRKNLMASDLFETVSIKNTVKKRAMEMLSDNVIGEAINQNVWNFIFEIQMAGVEEP